MRPFFQTWTHGSIPQDAQMHTLGGPMHGMLAQQVALSQEGVVRIPEHLSDEDASTLPCAALTAWNGLVESANPLTPGTTVLTLGTGGVSVFATQFAKTLGFEVIATSSDEGKIKRLKAMGVNKVVNYKQTPEWDKEVLAINGGKNVDHVIEVGGSGTLQPFAECDKNRRHGKPDRRIIRLGQRHQSGYRAFQEREASGHFNRLGAHV